MTLSSILEWKRYLMYKLNAGEFRADEWRGFIDAATEAGFQTIADDMQKRLDHYTKTKEHSCTRN